MKKRQLFLVFLIASCVKSGKFDPPGQNCTTEESAVLSFAELRSLYRGETFQIKEKAFIKGYVVSSDRAGNFFGSLYLQDIPEAAQNGLELSIDLREVHLWFETGTEVLVNLQDLYFGKKAGKYSLGGPLTSFGTLSVGRLPANKVFQHLIPICGGHRKIGATELRIPEITDDFLATLVTVRDVEFVEAESGVIFAIPREDTDRPVTDCLGNTIALRSSGYADFQGTSLPKGKGSISGILDKDGKDYHLMIRDLNDIQFQEGDCAEERKEITSNKLFISELADPDNDPAARFIEIYNGDTLAVDLAGWELRRYTNSGAEVSSRTPLGGLIIDPGGVLVIAADTSEFEKIYGFPPDKEGGRNSVADSNGDDNMELVDPLGTVIDVFGVPGEDGSGSNHEFEDGRAVRDSSVTRGNPVYTFTEWIIYNDTGSSGTVNLPQQAPQDFSPGIR